MTFRSFVSALMKARIDRWWSLVTVAYVAAIYRLSSLPDLGAPERHPGVLLVMNLAHAPLFAGLAFCVLKNLSAPRDVSWPRYVLAFVASAACAAVDEWHQSFVPGRHASIGDFLLDLAGIGGMLFLLHLFAEAKQRRRVGGITRPTPPALSAPLLRPSPATGHLGARSGFVAVSKPKLSGTGSRQ